MASTIETDRNCDELVEEGKNLGSELSCDEGHSPSDEELRSQDKGVKTEELLHLPEELRHLLMEYKTADTELKDEIRFLQPLAEFYQQQYEAQPDLWMSGLRAHGLWMACSLRDPENSDYIQSAFKLMNSELSSLQLSTINTENKELLKQYRETHSARTSEVKSLLSNIDSNNWSNNLHFMVQFTSVVRDLSDCITHDVKHFFGRLIDQCIDSLGRSPPCGLAVIAIGSLARSETTSYSDIEYMFLIEEGSNSSMKYFRKLAFQSYYFLSLLGESNLRTYYIKELNAVGFSDRCTKSLRIDGLAEKAGNQPTGNQIEGSELLFTLEELLARYHSILLGQLRGPNKGVPSDFVDMIIHRKLIWSNGNGHAFYKRLEESLKDIVHPPERIVNSQQLLQNDLKEYNFLPELNHKHSGHQEVKRDLYRYPSLLLTGLNNVLNLKSRSNWATIDGLVTRGHCSDDTGVILSFLLASAVFTRIDCYNFYHEQNDRITLFTSEKNSPQYSCSRNLFILMASYLFPLKPLMAQSKSISCSVVIPSFQQNIFRAVCITNFYCGAYGNVVTEFIRRYEEKIMFEEVDEFLHKVPKDQLETLFRSLYESNSFTERHIKMLKTAATLYPNMCMAKYMKGCYHGTEPSKALVYAQEQLTKTPNDDLESMFESYVLVANCFCKMKDFIQCEEMLNTARTYLDGVMGSFRYTQQDTLRMIWHHLSHLGSLKYWQKNYDEHLRVTLECLNVCERLYGRGVIHVNVSSSLRNIGLALRSFNRHPEALEFFIRSLEMDYNLFGLESDHSYIAITLMNIGCVKRDMTEFEQALDFLTRSYDMSCRLHFATTPTHPDITSRVRLIAMCHLKMSNNKEALQWLKEQYANLTGANVVDKERLAFCTLVMGWCHKKLADYKSAIESFNEGLKLYREINQDGKYDREVASECLFIALCHYDMSDYKEALQWCKEEYTSLIEAKVVDKKSLAHCAQCIGMCHKKLEDYKSAIESYSESLKLYREINQDGKYDASECYNIASCHYDMSDYKEALQWRKEEYTSLIEAKVVDKKSLAHCAQRIGMCHKKLEDYKSAIESYSESLKLYREINQDGKYDSEVASECYYIASCHYDMSDYKEALQWRKEEYTSLIEAKVVDKKSLAHCAQRIGMCHKKLEDYKSAIESYSESLKLYREINQDGKYDREVASECFFIALCHYDMSDYKEALQWRKEEYTSLIEAKVVDKKSLAHCAQRIGMCHKKLEDYKSAIESYSESLKLYREINQDGKYDREVASECYCIALCHYDMSDYKEALQWHKEEYTSLIEANVVDKKSFAHCAQRIGMCHGKLEDYKSAIESFNEGLKLYREINQDGKYDREITELLANIQECESKLG